MIEPTRKISAKHPRHPIAAVVHIESIFALFTQRISTTTKKNINIIIQ